LPSDFFEKLEPYKRVLLTPHEQPDADGIGSVLGLSWHLRSLGKETRLIVAPGVPSFLKFLDTNAWIECFDSNTHKDIGAWPDCWVAADASELSRLGPLKDHFAISKAAKFCIDHHICSSSMDAFDYFFRDHDASSTCELVLEALGPNAGMPLPMAQALYAGMVDDTGSFRFPCTTPKVLRMAAALLEIGVQPDFVYRGLYNQGTPSKMRISGIAFERMQLHCDERIAVMTASLADMRSVGAIHEDLEGLVNKPMELRTVEVSALAYEKPDGNVKVSMRSKSRIDVNAICRQFGGGGHRLASGVTLPGPIESALDMVIPAIGAKIEQDIAQ
jgi:phosphoesterase RecJ-like protein